MIILTVQTLLVLSIYTNGQKKYYMTVKKGNEKTVLDLNSLYPNRKIDSQGHLGIQYNLHLTEIDSPSVILSSCTNMYRSLQDTFSSIQPSQTTSQLGLIPNEKDIYGETTNIYYVVLFLR